MHLSIQRSEDCFLLAGHVLECWRCDGILFRVAEESQPCQLWKTNLQIWEGLKLPPPQWVQICSLCFCLDTDCIYIVWQHLFITLETCCKLEWKIMIKRKQTHSYKFFCVCVRVTQNILFRWRDSMRIRSLYFFIPLWSSKFLQMLYNRPVYLFYLESKSFH